MLTWRSTSLPSVAGRCAIKPRSAGHLHVRAHNPMSPRAFSNLASQAFPAVGLRVKTGAFVASRRPVHLSPFMSASTSAGMKVSAPEGAAMKRKRHAATCSPCVQRPVINQGKGRARRCLSAVAPLPAVGVCKAFGYRSIMCGSGAGSKAVGSNPTVKGTLRDEAAHRPSLPR